MRLETGKKNKFWRRMSLKKWINKRREKEKYEADILHDTDSELEDCQDLWEFDFERRFSYSANESTLLRSHSIDFQPRHSSATLRPKDSEDLRLRFSDTHQFRVFVGTWNVGGREPTDNLDIDEWLGSLKEPADIYVFGFQEVVRLNAGNVLGSENNTPAVKWQQLIRHTLNKLSSTAYKFRRSCSTPSSLQHNFKTPDSTDSFSNEFCGTNLTSFVSRGAPFLSPTFNSRSPGHRSLHNRSRYVMLASKQMVGLLVCVWVRSELRQNIRNVKVSCIGCGLMGYLGNKGSISVSMCLHQTTFCFVCSHLASGQRDGDEFKRNADVADILKRTQFRRSHELNEAGLPETILEHDRVIWLGDLNYRLALSPRITRSLLAKEDWDALLEKDQLQLQRRAGRVFNGWKEGKIYFAPTYKYRANSNIYTLEKVKLGGKTRTPAWCDRILWFGNGLNQLAYVRAETKLSDHRPVYAVFSADVEVLSRKKLKDFLILKTAKVEIEELLPFYDDSAVRKFM